MQRHRVLIVEDDSVTGRYLLEALKDCFDSEVVSTALGAMDRMGRKDNPISVVLLDLRLPDGSGEELVRMIHKANPIPIVAITADPNFNATQMIVAGAHSFLRKPDVGPNLILDTITQTLARHENRVECAKQKIDAGYKEAEDELQAVKSSLSCQQAALSGNMAVLDQCPILTDEAADRTSYEDCPFKERCPVANCPIKGRVNLSNLQKEKA